MEQDKSTVEDFANQTKISFKVALDKIQEWIEIFIGHIPNMAVAILIFILFFILARYSKKWTTKLFDPTKNDVIKNLSTGLVYYCIIGLGIFIILDVLQLKTAVTSLLAGVGIIGIALGFAFQDIAANFLSGIILAYRRPFDILDIIQSGEYIGTVTQINIRDTVLRTYQGQEVVVPNKTVIQNPIINYTHLGQRRIDLSFRVSFTENLADVKEISLSALKPIKQIIRRDEINFAYIDFGHSFVNFEVRFWIKFRKEADFINSRTLAIIEIKKALDKNGISLPFEVRINQVMTDKNIIPKP